MPRTRLWTQDHGRSHVSTGSISFEPFPSRSLCSRVEATVGGGRHAIARYEGHWDRLAALISADRGRISLSTSCRLPLYNYGNNTNPRRRHPGKPTAAAIRSNTGMAVVNDKVEISHGHSPRRHPPAWAIRFAPIVALASITGRQILFQNFFFLVEYREAPRSQSVPRQA